MLIQKPAMIHGRGPQSYIEPDETNDDYKSSQAQTQNKFNSLAHSSDGQIRISHDQIEDFVKSKSPPPCDQVVDNIYSTNKSGIFPRATSEAIDDGSFIGNFNSKEFSDQKPSQYLTNAKEAHNTLNSRNSLYNPHNWPIKVKIDNVPGKSGCGQTLLHRP